MINVFARPRLSHGPGPVKLRCRVGLHRAVNDFSVWDNGFNVSACADCGAEMTKRPGSKWQAIKRSER